MSFIDYYKILGIKRDTPQSEVRSAYKRRAKQFHPDLHPDDPKAKAKFQALTEAYEVLGDPEKRKKYDQYGEHWREAEAFGQGGRSGANGFEGFDFSQFAGGGFSSFFSDLFGGGATHRRSHVRTPSTTTHTVKIDFYTALLGGSILIDTGTEKLRLNVRPVVQNGQRVRLSGKGPLLPGGTRGDLILKYEVEMPKQLNEAQQRIVRQLREAE